MTRAFPWAALLAALSACVAAGDKAPHGTVPGNIDIALPTPDGYCELLDRFPADHQILLIAEMGHAGRNQILSMFADCRELAAFREGGVEPGLRLSYLMPLSSAGRHINLPRSQVVANLTEDAHRADPLATVGPDIQRRFERAGFGSNPGEVVSLGVLRSDDTALYLGAVRNVETGHGETARTLTVNGVTVVDGRLLGISLGGPYQGPDSVERMLATTQAQVLRLIAAN